MAKSIRLGKLFEAQLTEELCFSFRKSGDSGFVPSIGTDADYFSGTDAVVWGVPTDFTYACCFSTKDHTEWLGESFSLLNFVEVRYGIRTGNACSTFRTPVLVVAVVVPSDSFLGTYLDAIVEAFVKKFGRIMDAGQSLYWDWVDAHDPELA